MLTRRGRHISLYELQPFKIKVSNSQPWQGSQCFHHCTIRWNGLRNKTFGNEYLSFQSCLRGGSFSEKNVCKIREDRDGIRGREGESALPLYTHSLDLSVFVSDMKPSNSWQEGPVTCARARALQSEESWSLSNLCACECVRARASDKTNIWGFYVRSTNTGKIWNEREKERRKI